MKTLYQIALIVTVTLLTFLWSKLFETVISLSFKLSPELAALNACLILLISSLVKL